MGGGLELGGPVVGFVIVLILGFWLPYPAANISFTVYVHGPKGFQDLPLRNNGRLMLDTGDLRREAAIGSNGEALFPEISASFRGRYRHGFWFAIPQSEFRNSVVRKAESNSVSEWLKPYL